MEIINVDPLQNGLLFERFLNPERVSMPDVDVDFCQNRRGEVIEYVTRKYGREQVAQIITFNTMAAKAAIKDCGRALDMPYGDVDRIAKLVPATVGMTLDKALEECPTCARLTTATRRFANCWTRRRSLKGWCAAAACMRLQW
jgi:DNA polymerase-3 subunit alpha